MSIFRNISRTMLLLTLIGLVFSGCTAASRAGKQSLTLGQDEEKTEQKGNDSALRLARLLCAQGRYQGALSIYGRLDQRGVLTPLELLEYANVTSLVSPPKDTLSLFLRAEKALTETKKELAPEKTCELHTGLGRARMAVGQFEKAIENFDIALEAVPEHIAALNAKGVLLDAKGDHARARELLSKANELAPTDVRILNNLALSYLSGGYDKEAIQYFNQAQSLEDSPSIQLNQAFTYFMSDNTEKTLSSLQEFMPRQQANTFMDMFGKMRERIQAEESTISEELLRAAGKLIEINPPVKRGRTVSTFSPETTAPLKS